MNEKHLIVIGGGIASETFLFYLLQDFKNGSRLKQQQLKVTQIFTDEVLPSCSLRSTAFVCLRGVKKGLSSFGDNLYDAYFELENFFNQYRPEGITKGRIQHFHNTENTDKFFRRYGTTEKVEEDCYFFSPDKFFNWIQNQNNELSKYIKFERIYDEVVEINPDENKIRTALLQKNEDFDFLFLAPGAYFKLHEERYLRDSSVHRGQIVSGCFYTFNQDCGESSFGFSFDEGYCIYRSDSKELIVGSTSETVLPSENKIFSEHSLEIIYKSVTTKLSPIISIPAATEGIIRMGLRHKGQKRRPFWGKIYPNKEIYSVLGLYKNGYSLPFLAAKELVKNFPKE